MRFDLRPLQGVGPIEFGMPRAEVRRILAAPFKEFMKTPDSKTPTDDIRALDLHVNYDEAFGCLGIEFWPDADLRVDGLPVVGQPWSDVRIWLATMAPGFVVKDSLILAKEVGLSLYVPDLDDGPAAPVASAYVFKDWV